MPLPLESDLAFGFITGFNDPRAAREQVALAEGAGFDSLWVGDHIAFPVPIMDSLAQLACAAGMTDTLTLGTCVYLLPLRHPVPVAKQVTTLDHLTRGRFIFGAGIGGEFPNEYAACGVPVRERGARMTEAITVMKLLAADAGGGNEDGRFYPFPPVRLQPAPVTPGGPPIWCGGRSDAALARCGRLADGWVSYVVTPGMYAAGLASIESAAAAVGREFDPARPFGTGHLLFARIEDSFERALDLAAEHLSQRYAMDFRAPARKYAALGTPEDVAERIAAFAAAGVRHFVLDMVGPAADRAAQLERFAREVRPLL